MPRDQIYIGGFYMGEISLSLGPLVQLGLYTLIICMLDNCHKYDLRPLCGDSS